MTDQNNNNGSDNSRNSDVEIVVTQENPNVPLGYSKKLQIGGTKLLIVDKEENVVSGEAPSCCVVGSPEHVGKLI